MKSPSDGASEARKKAETPRTLGHETLLLLFIFGSQDSIRRLYSETVFGNRVWEPYPATAPVEDLQYDGLYNNHAELELR